MLFNFSTDNYLGINEFVWFMAERVTQDIQCVIHALYADAPIKEWNFLYPLMYELLFSARLPQIFICLLHCLFISYLLYV